jgi:conjugative transfer signal peptidase TraF
LKLAVFTAFYIFTTFIAFTVQLKLLIMVLDMLNFQFFLQFFKRFFFLAAVFVAAFYLSLSNLYINISNSVPLGLYFAVGDRAIQRGDYVIFYLPESIAEQIRGRPWFDEKTSLLKIVAGLPGDTYGVTENNYYVNYKLIGRTSPTDKQGKPLPQLPAGEHTVEAAHFLPAGTAANSFDSRYYGEVPLARVKAKVVPLLTFGERTKLFP